MSRPPVSRASRPPPRQQRGLQEIWVYEARCRDTTIHNTFMCGDMKGVHTVLKDPCMVNALMETVHEEMVWAPELGRYLSVAEVDADPGGSTALHDACIGGHDSCVQLLLAHGADPDLLAEDGSAPLHLCIIWQVAAGDGGAEVNVLTSETKITPLHVVARRGLEEHVKLFLSHGADVSARNREGRPPECSLWWAERPAEVGRYLRVVQMLLGAGADHCTAGRKHHTPLHNACSNCSPRIAEIVLQHGAKADMQNCAGYTPMDCLLQVGLRDYPDQHPEAVARSLLNHGAKAGKSLMLKLCLLSPATLEVMLNCYAVVPSCEEWMQSIPLEIHETHQGFFDSVRQMTSQPRSLQHLCGCALRHHLGKGIDAAISRLDVPSSLMEYLLLRNDGEIR
uniref:Ankyrin repeat and SOCS box containing 16 n=1 Tax=Oncorhynchus tshawytscha TaxID=74940 RepID=A0AAZ3PRJ7_ONCTS